MSRLLIAPDARAAEAWLSGEVARWLDLDHGADPEVLGPGVRVIVPSHSLRDHVEARLLDLRPAWLRVEVATLRATAAKLLADAGEPLPRGRLLFPLELERAARRRPVLARAFAEFTDGWAPLRAAARDLVDAGFQPAHLEPLWERIEAERGSLPGRVLDRARALLAVVVEALARLDERGLAPDSALFVRAAELVQRRGGAALAHRRNLIHGFADATGVAADLLEALVRHAGAQVVLVRPPELGTGGGEWAFGGRLLERLRGAAGVPVALPPAPAARIRILAAPTPDAEARAVAVAATQEAAATGRAEAVGIVLREPTAPRAALRRELERLGTPYSGSVASGPRDPLAHRARAVLELIERRGECATDLALTLLDEIPDLPAGERAGVRLALRALGAARLEEVRRLSRASLLAQSERGFPLPVRSGIEVGEHGEFAPRRRLPIAPLLACLDRLARLSDLLERWPARASWRRQVARLERVLDLCSPAASGWPEQLVAALGPLGPELPEDLLLERREAAELFAGAWEPLERRPWAGLGAGVQVLSVVEARCRTFDRLLVPGLVRGVFPRGVGEDAVLPDTLRLRLRDLLPDLPVKREGHDEERFLFSELLGAAASIVLCHATHDAEGRAQPVSPLVAAVVRERPATPSTPPSATTALAILDRALEAALSGREPALTPWLAAAFEEGNRRYGTAAAVDPGALAAARIRVLEEFDADPATPAGRERIRTLGPYFGFVAPAAGGGAVAATTLEVHASCGWRALLERTLRLEPAPDPLAALPGIDGALLGVATHDALRRLFAPGNGAALAEILTAPGSPLVWPDEPAIERASGEAAARALAEAGLAGHPLQAVLARRVRGRLAVARELDAEHPAAHVLGVEVDGDLDPALPDHPAARLHFRADRVQREGGRLAFIDFKTGRVPSALRLRTPDGRDRKLLDSVASGERLQAAIYLAAGGGRPAEARYLYLDPGDDAPAREFALREPAAAAQALTGTVAVLLAAREAGYYPPRLLDEDLEREFAGCRYCAVAEACLQRDSGYRVRLERWHRLQEPREHRPAREELLWRLWRLPAGPEREP